MLSCAKKAVLFNISPSSLCCIMRIIRIEIDDEFPEMQHSKLPRNVKKAKNGIIYGQSSNPNNFARSTVSRIQTVTIHFLLKLNSYLVARSNTRCLVS